MFGNGDDHYAATRSESDAERLVAARYRLYDVLGQGGMGTVWRAHDLLLDRPVAAKELHLLTHGDEAQRVRVRRAIREARAVARVPHPHVVGIHDLVESADRLWIVMELVEGPSLAQHAATNGPLSPRRTAILGLQLLDALEAVHPAGTLHRDVKPANVLLRPDGNAVLTDFGIAALDDGEFLTGTGELVGSLEYMAPERLTGTEVGPASDLWSLGATLAAVCGGDSPFRRPARPATLHAVVYEEPVLSERLGPLRPVVEALLRKTAADRPSASGARSALRRVAAGEPDAGPLPAATARSGAWHPLADADTMTSGGQRLEPTGRPKRRRVWWALAGTAVLAAGVVGGLRLTGTPPFAEKGPQTTSAVQTVESATGWQSANGVTVRKGDRVTVRFLSGEWTAAQANMPMTGPSGYDAETDAILARAADCKIKSGAPFGTLLARLAGEQDYPVHVVGRKLTFRAAGDGVLQLGMNDAAGACSQDNRGTLTVRVGVTHTD